MAVASPNDQRVRRPVSHPALGGLLVLTAIAVLMAGTHIPSKWALAVLLGAGFVALAAARPREALMATVLYAEVVAGLVKNIEQGSTASAAIPDAMAAIVLVAAVARFGVVWPKTTLDWLVALFIALVVLMALVNPAAPHGVQLLGGVRTLVLYLPFYFLARDLVPTRARERLLLTTIVVGGAVLGVVSMVQYVMGPTWSQQHHLTTRVVLGFSSSGGAFRPPSLFPLPGVAGMVFAALLVINVALLMRPQGRSYRLLILTLLPIAFGLFASGQRAAMLGAGLALVLLGVVTRSRILIGTVLICGALALGASVLSGGGGAVGRVSSVSGASSTSSTSSRFHTWSSVIRQIPVFPFGHGPGYTGSSALRFGSRTGATPRVVSDNYWIKQLWEMGLLGALWYTALLIVAIRLALHRFKYETDRWGTLLPLVMFGLLVQQAAASLFTNSLDPSPYNLLFWLLLGLLRTPPRPDRDPVLVPETDAVPAPVTA